MENLKIKSLLIILLASFVSTNALAANQYAHINKGNVSVSGSVSLNYNSVSGTYFIFKPSAQYFFKDGFSFGGSINYSIYNSSNYLVIGPGFNYYFWSQDKMAAYFGGDILLNSASYSSTTNVTLDGFIGLNWFAIPSVAFGPNFEISHLFTNPDSASNTYYTVLAAFSIFF